MKIVHITTGIGIGLALAAFVIASLAASSSVSVHWTKHEHFVKYNRSKIVLVRS